MLAFFSGCVPTVNTRTLESPSIRSIFADCSRDADQWEIRVFADAWTKGGHLFFATPTHHESHTIESIRASPTGQSDELLIQLPIEANPDEATANQSSAFLCTETVLNTLYWRVSVFDYHSEEESDCWQWGADIDLGDFDYGNCDFHDPSES